jgi:hypothetical protein
MSDSEFSPDNSINPLHEMPPINRRSFDHAENQKYDFNLMKPVPRPLPPSVKHDPQSTA